MRRSRVAAIRSGEPVPASPLSMLRVESVGMVDGSIRLRTEGQVATRRDWPEQFGV